MTRRTSEETNPARAANDPMRQYLRSKMTAAGWGESDATPRRVASDGSLEEPAAPVPDGGPRTDPLRAHPGIAQLAGFLRAKYDAEHPDRPEPADAPAPDAGRAPEREPDETAEEYRARLVRPRVETFGTGD